jgi:hypothetical protein
MLNASWILHVGYHCSEFKADNWICVSTSAPHLRDKSPVPHVRTTGIIIEVGHNYNVISKKEEYLMDDNSATSVQTFVKICGRSSWCSFLQNKEDAEKKKRNSGKNLTTVTCLQMLPYIHGGLTKWNIINSSTYLSLVPRFLLIWRHNYGVF